jgi:hypothetical protein
MTARYPHADVTTSGNMRFCAEYFDRRSEFERRILVNGVAATGDSISISRTDGSPDQQKLHPAA